MAIAVTEGGLQRKRWRERKVVAWFSLVAFKMSIQVEFSTATQKGGSGTRKRSQDLRQRFRVQRKE